MLTREQILGANDLPRVKVKVPEWGGDVYVKTMDGAERTAFEAAQIGDKENNVNRIRARLCVACVVGEDSVPLFTEDDVDALQKKSGAALTRVMLPAMKLNKLSDADFQELVGNSEGGPSAA